MTRVFTLEDTAAILDTFQKHGHKEIDTARVYGEGSSEEYLGDLRWQDRGLVMDTKLYPTAVRPALATEHYSHSPEDLRAGLMASLKALKIDKLHLWYLQGPTDPLPLKPRSAKSTSCIKKATLSASGISNYHSWEVAKICEICEHNGWIKPSVYQGLYNALHRAVESVSPPLRHVFVLL